MFHLVEKLQIPILSLIALFWLVLLLVVLNNTSPLQSGPVGTLLVFGLMYATVASFLYLLLHIGLKLWRLLTGKESALSRSLYYVVSIIALAPVFMVALNTLGQLGVAEALLVIVLVVLASFYVMRI